MSESTRPFSKASKSNALVILGIETRDPATVAPNLWRNFLRSECDVAINLVLDVDATFRVEAVNASVLLATIDSITTLKRLLGFIVVRYTEERSYQVRNAPSFYRSILSRHRIVTYYFSQARVAGGAPGAGDGPGWS